MQTFHLDRLCGEVRGGITQLDRHVSLCSQIVYLLLVYSVVGTIADLRGRISGLVVWVRRDRGGVALSKAVMRRCDGASGSPR